MSDLSNVTGDPATIQLDVAFRNFLFMRGQAVKDTRDAVTELITNAVDAYRKIPGHETLEKHINLNIHRVPTESGHKIYLQLTDQATGVDPEFMKICFLSAGHKTASDQARGFFSTGAKNISILGDVHFTSFRADHYSKVYLDDMSYGHIVTHSGVDPNDPTLIPDVIGVPLNNAQRQTYGIPGNGMNVIIEYTNQAQMDKLSTLEQIDDMLESVTKIGTMREIFNDPTFHIYRDVRNHAPIVNIESITSYTAPIIHTDYASYNHADASDNFGGMYYKRMTYEYPKGSLLLSTTFNVPNYPHYQARFVMYKTDKPLPQPARENQMEFGFLIKDSFAVHEVNTLGENDRYRWNPNINYLFGYVFCEGFNQELKRYDNEETKDLILDPNRVGGINHDHPLYKSILTVCLPRLEKAIKEVQEESAFKSINIDELDTIISELEKMGVNIFDDSDITFNFVTDSEGPLAISLKETENHIVNEISSEINVRLISDSVIDELDRAMASFGDDGGNYVYYQDVHNNIRPLELSEDDLQSIIDGIDDINVEKPFIYKMDNGDWSRVEIYQRGKIDRLKEHDDSLLKVEHKSLTIQFINDINYKQKYVIDTTNGVVVKINLHNELVAEKLSGTKIDNIDDSSYSFKLSDEASYDALNFLETIMIQAFTDIIVNNDITNGKVATEDGGANDAKRVVEYWNSIEADIEGKIHTLFVNFLVQKRQAMVDQMYANIDGAKEQIVEMVTSGTATLEDIEIGAETLMIALENSIQSVING